jgi:DNA (cytosine-5)-methyltransferase 1
VQAADVVALHSIQDSRLIHYGKDAMKYLSVCSGIEAASVAWHHLGWEPVGFSEIEPFPSAVLAHRFPNVPNFGDMTKFKEWPIEPGSIDILVGGTPCQSFSVAGLRAGLEDPRGGLMLTYLEIARRLRPRWIVWENVPGVLSSAGGRDFGSFLGALGDLGYGWAYRILDAQWVRTQRHPGAVPQRRRRVFVVGCLGDWERAAQVLFERESVCRDSAPRRAKGQGVAADAEGCVGISSVTSHEVAPCLETTCHDYSRADGSTMIAQPVAGTLGNRGVRSHTELDGHGAYIPVQPFTKSKRAQSNSDDETWVQGQVNPTLSLFDQGDTRATTVAVAFQQNTRDEVRLMNGDGQIVGALAAEAGMKQQNYLAQSATTPAVAQAMTVRRLTPRECERLQGFPDDYTLIPWRKKQAEDCPDGPRYKALGNSMAVNCMEWIGERIAEVSK